MKKIVIPGDLITEERKRTGNHVFVENGKIYSDVLGITDTDSPVASVIALQGQYVPMMDDLIVGIITSERFAGYGVQINSFYDSFISKKEIRDPLKIGDVVSAKISNVNEVNEVDIANIRIFYGGEIIKISPVKVPRVIGKSGSMMDVLKQGTGSSLLVGRNGLIWIKGGDTALAIKAVRKIEAEAHLGNLTNKIEAFLKENKKDTQVKE